MKRRTLLLPAAVTLMLYSCAKKQTPDAFPDKETTMAATAASPDGDVVGKATVGYQAWFSAAGDGSPLNSWGHQNLEMWPDVREYQKTYSGSPFNQGGVAQPPYTGNLGNGQPARMFSSHDQQVVNTHAKWMQQNGIDCIALQRFGSYFQDPGSALKKHRDNISIMVKNAAEAYGRKFYIMYDVSSSSKFDEDWTNTIVNSQHLTSSPAYARQNGKPVVCLWGVGKSGRGDLAGWVAKINWFKAQGCYVIGAPLANFSTDAPNQQAYDLCDMIMPWWVGKRSNFQSSYASDLAYCNARGIDYQGCTYPGTAFYNTNGSASPKNQIPRMHGDFMWSQFAGMRNAGVHSMYIAMFDELNEATNIFKTAENTSQIPAGKYFLTLDADGASLSSDFYLRLSHNGIKMMKGQIPYQGTHTTPFR